MEVPTGTRTTGFWYHPLVHEHFFSPRPITSHDHGSSPLLGSASPCLHRLIPVPLLLTPNPSRAKLFHLSPLPPHAQKFPCQIGAVSLKSFKFQRGSYQDAATADHEYDHVSRKWVYPLSFLHLSSVRTGSGHGSLSFLPSA